MNISLAPTVSDPHEAGIAANPADRKLVYGLSAAYWTAKRSLKNIITGRMCKNGLTDGESYASSIQENRCCTRESKHVLRLARRKSESKDAST
jgi:hypothetical protein